jgi:hypothetical protein
VDEKEAQLYLKDVDKIHAERTTILTFTQWNFGTDINDENEKKVVSLRILYYFVLISCCE